MIVWVEAYRAGLLARPHWLRNVLSGLIVGIVALPLAMAFAIASGAKPEQGIYTAIVAGIVVSIAGGSRFQIAGPTGAFIVILAAVTAEHGIEGLQIATLMAGVMLLLFGIARVGAAIKFIPAPVIVGFTAGIAVIIFVGQWQAFFGLAPIAGEHFHNKLANIIAALPHLHAATTALAVGSLVILLVMPRVPVIGKIPAPLIALLAATCVQAAAHFDGVATIGSAFGGIPQGLPGFSLPHFSVSKVLELLGPAFTIAMLGAIESLLSAVVADGMTGTRHDSNQELIGQGLANIAAPLFGGFAATGALARTATNVRNGGNSPIAGIVHAALLVLVLVSLAPLAVHIPLAVLAAILFVVAWNMSEAKHFVRMLRRAPRADVVILLVTFGLTVFADLVIAVNIGVILAMLHFMRRMASSVAVTQANGAELQDELALRGQSLPEGVMVFAVSGPLFFGAVENFERALAHTHTDPKAVIVRMDGIPFIDITGMQSLEEAIHDLQKRGVRVVLAGANARVAAKLRRARVIRLVGPENFVADLTAAIVALQPIGADTRW